MNESWRHYAKQKKPATKGQMLHYSPHVKYLAQSVIQKGSTAGGREGGYGEEESVFSGYNVSVLQDENIQKMCGMTESSYY